MPFNLFRWKKRPTPDRTSSHQWGVMADNVRRGGEIPSPSTRNDALKLFRDLGFILQSTDPRAARARKRLETTAFHPGTDWRWRPDIFCGPVAPAGLVAPEPGLQLGGEVSIWHDCVHKALSIRQISNQKLDIQTPFGIRLETLSFVGDYLSLSIELPLSILEWLGTSHVLRLDLSILAESKIEVYGRLNIAQGPNTEQVLREIDDPTTDHPGYRTIEFDLAYADLAERAVEKVWLDVIFKSPYMNAVNLHDMMLSRYPRAEV